MYVITMFWKKFDQANQYECDTKDPRFHRDTLLNGNWCYWWEIGVSTIVSLNYKTDAFKSFCNLLCKLVQPVKSVDGFAFPNRFAFWEILTLAFMPRKHSSVPPDCQPYYVFWSPPLDVSTGGSRSSSDQVLTGLQWWSPDVSRGIGGGGGNLYSEVQCTICNGYMGTPHEQTNTCETLPSSFVGGTNT